MIDANDSARVPSISVLIGLVSTEDTWRILETLTALAEAQGNELCEVILVNRRKDGIETEIFKHFPEVHVVGCSPTMTLPEMRTLALTYSRGNIVAVTEDHCVPCPGWLSQIRRAFEQNPGLLAVGGAVENGVFETSFDWATFLCEYSYFSPPVTEGWTDVLPGMNVAYSRIGLDAIPMQRLGEGFWETTVHPLLLKQGGAFLSLNAMKMYHCKKFSVRLFMRQRFVYSRYYSGLRFAREDRVRRFCAMIASLALPPILLYRIARSACAKGLQSPLVRALPALLPIVVVWSFGEMWGYALGPGDSLAEIE